MIKDRYQSWDEGIGSKIESIDVGFTELKSYMLEKGEANSNSSGRQSCLRILESVLG